MLAAQHDCIGEGLQYTRRFGDDSYILSQSHSILLGKKRANKRYDPENYARTPHPHQPQLKEIGALATFFFEKHAPLIHPARPVVCCLIYLGLEKTRIVFDLFQLVAEKICLRLGTSGGWLASDRDRLRLGFYSRVANEPID